MSDEVGIEQQTGHVVKEIIDQTKVKPDSEGTGKNIVGAMLKQLRKGNVKDEIIAAAGRDMAENMGVLLPKKPTPNDN